MESIVVALFAGTACALAGCSSESGECENTLMLETADRGTAHTIDDGCTSLLVSLGRQGEVTYDSVPGVDQTLLRFDYLHETAETLEYYFTPLHSGEALVQIGAQPAAFAWTSTVTLALPD